jgi:hypothetical protein
MPLRLSLRADGWRPRVGAPKLSVAALATIAVAAIGIETGGGDRQLGKIQSRPPTILQFRLKGEHRPEQTSLLCGFGADALGNSRPSTRPPRRYTLLTDG